MYTIYIICIANSFYLDNMVDGVVRTNFLVGVTFVKYMFVSFTNAKHCVPICL